MSEDTIRYDKKTISSQIVSTSKNQLLMNLYRGPGSRMWMAIMNNQIN